MSSRCSREGTSNSFNIPPIDQTLIPCRCSLLLHSETSDGSVVPVWDDCDERSIASVREIMEEKDHESAELTLKFTRLPLSTFLFLFCRYLSFFFRFVFNIFVFPGGLILKTKTKKTASEQPLDFADISNLTQIVLRTNLDETAIVLNDQLGRGRVSRSLTGGFFGAYLHKLTSRVCVQSLRSPPSLFFSRRSGLRNTERTRPPTLILTKSSKPKKRTRSSKENPLFEDPGLPANILSPLELERPLGRHPLCPLKLAGRCLGRSSTACSV